MLKKKTKKSDSGQESKEPSQTGPGGDTQMQIPESNQRSPLVVLWKGGEVQERG